MKLHFYWCGWSVAFFWYLLATPKPTLAQSIVPDRTLPVNSIVTNQGNTNLITGGTTAGSNLFHSFTQFSVPTGNTAYFNNSATIQNIITRVTGSSGSAIDGVLKANGTANLFLINPNGIVFGQDASLSIGGSFLATTANSLKFSDGMIFSATNPQTPALLSINVPIGLQFGSTPQPISNSSQTISNYQQVVGLEVPSGKTLALIGGNLTLTGGTLTAPEGQIELGSLSGAGTVNFNQTGAIGKTYVFDYTGIQNFGDIQLSQGAVVDVSGDGGGNINVQGRNLSLTDGSQIRSNTFGTKLGGSLTVNASDSVTITGQAAGANPISSALLANVNGNEVSGHGSNLTINTRQLLVQNAGFISTATSSSGTAGDLTVNASDSVELTGNGAFLDGSTSGSGHGSNLTINTRQLLVQNAGFISTATSSSGAAGNLTVNASDSVELTGDGTSLVGSTYEGSSGHGSNLTINTRQLLVQSPGFISTATFSSGAAGDLTINASDSVELTGDHAFLIGSTYKGSGHGSNLTINTKNLLLQNGAQAISVVEGTGKGGNLIINATNSVELIGTTTTGKDGSALFTAVQNQGSGNSGNVIITTKQLSIQDGAGVFSGANSGTSGAGGNTIVRASDFVKVTGTDIKQGLRSTLHVGSYGSGSAGNLIIDTGKLIIDHGANIFAVSASVNAGDITIDAQQLLLRHNSSLSAKSGGAGDGGNIKLNLPTGTITALENSEITANADQGSGGKIMIETQSVFAPLVDKQITAASSGGLQGLVEITTLGVDPTNGIVNLTQQVFEPSNQIAQRCSRNLAKTQDQFVITGNGGLPETPSSILIPYKILPIMAVHQGRAIDNKAPQPAIANTWQSVDPIQEATGFTSTPDGKVTLVAKVTQPSNSDYSICFH